MYPHAYMFGSVGYISVSIIFGALVSKHAKQLNSRSNHIIWLDLLYSSIQLGNWIRAVVVLIGQDYCPYRQVWSAPGYEPNTSLCWIDFGSGGNKFDDEVR
jgi:hypothetical protein